MNWPFMPYAAVLALVATIVLVVAGVAWSRRTMPGGLAFAWLLLLIAEWAAASAMEGIAAGLQAKIFWGKASYLGVVFVPLCFLIFTARYTAQDRWLARSRIAFLMVIPLGILLLAATNEHHHWLWRSITLDDTNQVGVALYVHGAAFWVIVGYNYLLLLAASLLLVRAIIVSPGLYRRHWWALLIGAALPWLGNLIYVSGLVPIPGLDLTPLAFALSGLVITWSMYRYQLFDVMPVARDLLVERMLDGVLVLDEQERLVDANPAAQRLLSLTAAGVLGRPVPEALAAYPDLAACCTAAGPTRESELQLTQDPRRYVHVLLSPVHDRRGRFVGRLVMLLDITRRKQAEAAEREQRALATALRDSSAILNSSLDLDTVLDQILEQVGRVLPNDAVAVYLVHDDGSPLGVRWRSAGHPFDPAALAKGLLAALADTSDLRQMAASRAPLVIADTGAEPTWQRLPGFEWIRSQAGAPVCAEDVLLGFLLAQSDTPGFYGLDDATRLQAFADQAAIAIRNAHLFAEVRSTNQAMEAANRELARRLVELEQRNQELDAFAHTVAHDLKNPLSQLMGFAELLAEEGHALAPADFQHALQIMCWASAKMNNILEELLLLAQVRRAEVTAVAISAADLADEAVQRLHKECRELRAEIVWSARESWPRVIGHAVWVEEVWVNYVSNALKYGGRPPRVELGATPLADGMVRFWVRDNGNGLSPEEQARLFAPFERISYTQITGYGLGLSIVRRIVERLGGQVGVESQAGQGSTFSFTLRAASGPA